MSLKELPEWDAMQAPPPLEKEALPKLISEPPAPKMNLSEKEEKPLLANPPSPAPFNQMVKNERDFQDEQPYEKPQGMGAGGKILIGFALLIFLGTLGVVGFFVYKNMDKFVQ
jgi:hypothetical protein